MQYCVAANYYWLLVEGVYLYTLLAFSVFSEQRIFRLYLSIGWGKTQRPSLHHPPPTTCSMGVGDPGPLPTWYSERTAGPRDRGHWMVPLGRKTLADGLLRHLEGLWLPIHPQTLLSMESSTLFWPNTHSCLPLPPMEVTALPLNTPAPAVLWGKSFTPSPGQTRP
jgi:hypothetical protein